MTPAELEALALGVAKLAFVVGLAGALALHIAMWFAHLMVEGFAMLVQRHQRIDAARMRNVHGPLVLPGAGRGRRDLLAAALRKRWEKAHG